MNLQKILRRSEGEINQVEFIKTYLLYLESDMTKIYGLFTKSGKKFLLCLYKVPLIPQMFILLPKSSPMVTADRITKKSICY